MLQKILSITLSSIPLIVCMGYGDGIRLPKEIAGVILLSIITAVSFYSYKMKRFDVKYLLVFFVWCVVTLVVDAFSVPVYMGNAIIDMPSSMFAWKELFYLLLAITTIYSISSAEVKESFDLRKIASVIAYVVIFMCGYSIIQALGFDEVFRVADQGSGFLADSPLTGKFKGAFTHRVVGTIGNPSILAIWLAMCVPMCIYLKNKLGKTAFVLAVIVIVLTKSAIGLASCGASILVITYYKNKKVFFSLVALSILIFIMLSNTTFLNPTGRVEVHKEAFNVLAKKPLFGMGLGTFEHLVGGEPGIVSRLGNQNWKELHDEYGQVWFSTGFVGLMAFVTFLYGIVRRFLTRRNEEALYILSSLVAIAIMATSHFPFRVAPLSIYTVIFVGLFLKYTGE